MNSLFSELLLSVPGVRHGFGTALEPFPAELEENWKRLKPNFKQVHGIACAQVLSAGQDCGDVDVLWTPKKGMPVAVATADCVPILLARRDGSRVAAVHAGWRGTMAQALPAFFDALPDDTCDPDLWVAAVGPAIGPCCYEVSPELAAEFGAEFAWIAEQGSTPVVRARYLDLPAINAAELKGMGVHEVELIRACTRCSHVPGGSRPLFHSYRREGSGTRQYSAIEIEVEID